MALEKAMKILKFDSRMTEWNLRHGNLTQEELKKHLGSLEDCSSNVVTVRLDEKSSESSHSSSGGSYSLN